MLFLILAILGGSMLSILMRLSEGRVGSKISMLAVNYVTCMLLSGIYMGFDLQPSAQGSGVTLGLGFVTGLFYVFALLLMQQCIRKNGVILPSVFSRLGGLLVPLLIAICFFGEKPSLTQCIGAALASLSIIAITSGGGRSAVTSIASLFFLLLTDGVAASMSTVFEKLGSADLSSQFLFYTFGTAFLVCLVLILKNREGLGWKEILFGLGIGIPNFFASRCLLLALKTVPAVIAYPTRGVASLMVITLAGLLFFRERLKPRQWAAMGTIMLSIILLNL